MSDITQAIKQICDEKGISYDSVMETIKAALGAAYRKDFGNKLQNIQVEFDPETLKLEVFDVKTVVEDVPEEELEAMEASDSEEEKNPQTAKEAEKKPITLSDDSPSAMPGLESIDSEKKHFNPKTEIQIKDAKEIKKSHAIGDSIKTQLEVPGSFGRMAAQTAKQVIIQKLREAERETVFNEFKNKEIIILVGTVQRREGRMVFVDLGKATALLPMEEQIAREPYMPGEHLKVLVVSVNKTTKGPGIIVSRSRPELVGKFFEMEIPEIASGVVQIKGVSREAGSRTKIAVWTDQDNIDPIGSCIGQRGARVQTIISELKGEKVDIILYSEDPEEYISNALKPAKITSMKLNKEIKSAVVCVPEDQLSLAIGKSGQNVRLAARLTGWKIDIETDGKDMVKIEEPAAEPSELAKEEIPAGLEKPAEEPKTEEVKKDANEDTPKKEKKSTKKTKKEKKDK